MAVLSRAGALTEQITYRVNTPTSYIIPANFERVFLQKKELFFLRFE
jgi:hypothetical protein